MPFANYLPVVLSGDVAVTSILFYMGSALQTPPTPNGYRAMGLQTGGTILALNMFCLLFNSCFLLPIPFSLLFSDGDCSSGIHLGSHIMIHEQSTQDGLALEVLYDLPLTHTRLLLSSSRHAGEWRIKNRKWTPVGFLQQRLFVLVCPVHWHVFSVR